MLHDLGHIKVRKKIQYERRGNNMESEVNHRIKAKHVYENELRRHAISPKKATFRLMTCLRCQSKILLRQGHQDSHQCDVI